MKLFIAALLCLSATAAAAQIDKPFESTMNRDTPTVVTQYDKTTGEIAGTTTIVGGKAYLRDRNGAHFATLTIDKNGTRHMADPEGHPIDAATIKQRLEEAK